MKELNMGFKIFGGAQASAPFLSLAQHLLGQEKAYEKFHEDTGRQLEELLEDNVAKQIEIVPMFYDWVALRYWGIETEPMTLDDVDEVYCLIKKVELPRKIFIKSDIKHINSMIGDSLVVKKDGAIVGALLVKNGYVDTIVSSHKGVGAHLLLGLPDGKYYTHVSQHNSDSLRLFKKFHMKHIKDEMVEGQERGFYEIAIEH